MDNGGEFCLLEFDNFCADHGIRRIKVVPFTPQENGAAERLNRTILEKV
jgi:transposase InsO family protein